MHSSVFALITTAKLVENALAVFVASVDSLGDALTQEQHDQAQEHVDKAHTILDVAQILATTKPTSAQAHSVDTEICAPERHGLQEPSQGTNPIALLSTSKNLETWGKEVAVHDGKNSVLLLTGVAKVKHPVTNQWKEVELLLDTGADESFIASELADQLGLVRNAQKELNVYSFGAEKPKHITSDLTTLEV
ncbi:hypothetical protein OSTOST_14727 [Ostertagia ostertagi]